MRAVLLSIALALFFALAAGMAGIGFVQILMSDTHKQLALHRTVPVAVRYTHAKITDEDGDVYFSNRQRAGRRQQELRRNRTAHGGSIL